MQKERSERVTQQQPNAAASAGVSTPAGPADEQPQPRADPSGLSFGLPVVCLGGSAGALDSFRSFLTAMPCDSGAAFVVIQHLAPSYKSALTEILAQSTRMRVVQAADGMSVEPNSVYVIAPNQYLGIRNGVLFLTEPVTEHGIRMPIDFFLRTLAEDRQERAIGILFSGAGSDGSLGVRAIRGGGGLTLAQDAQTAQFGDMPRNAVATGLVDCILPPDQMPRMLLAYLQQPYVRGGEPADVLDAHGKTGELQGILALVASQTGCDFRCYKKSTILRRIQRRMGLRHVSDVAEYGGLLRHDADEVSQLQKDLLINVTMFFRDKDAFEELRHRAVATLVRDGQKKEPVRVWVAGCSSGEEAYSVAMLLLEEVAEAHVNRAVQVFATDIDEDALQLARLGSYPESIAADVEPERLARFFVAKNHGYQVSEALRNTVVFASHNLVSDTPFSRMDLICCRNLLIYLDGDAQARVMPLFNFALNAGGYLFLGKSEGVSGRNDLFELVSKKARLYRRLAPARPLAFDVPLQAGIRKALPHAGRLPGILPPTGLGDVIRQALLAHFAASVVLVDHAGQVLQFHGQTGKYLDLPATEPSLNVFDIAKQGLSARLRTALHEAIATARTVVLDSVPITRDHDTLPVRVTIAPVTPRGDTQSMLAVIFEDAVPAAGTEPAPPAAAGSATIVRQLEDALRITEQDLQSSIQDLQASNEELRVSNEEVISTNEELQSSNEELETSKEELQSVNEELTTVNGQLQEKVGQLVAANSDITYFMEATAIATLFLDCDLRIRLFTPAATRVFKVLPSDVGRPLTDLSINFVGYDLTADVAAVAREACVLEREARHADGSSYLVRIAPFRKSKQRLDGLVVTFSDVTSLRRTERETRRLATVVTDSNDAVILFDLDGRILAWNRGAEYIYGWSQGEALRMNIRELAASDSKAEADGLMKKLLAGETVAACEVQRRDKSGRMLTIMLSATVMRDEAGKLDAVATTERDISQQRQAEEQAVLYRERLRRLAQQLADSEEKKSWQISRYIHDTIIQNLSLSSMRLGSEQKKQAAGHLAQAAGDIQATRDLIDEAIVECRTVMSDLTPPLLHELGLVPALRELAETFQKQHGIQICVSEEGDIRPMDTARRGLLFQTIRELVVNALKHAGPCTMQIAVTGANDTIRVRVQDNGHGFERENPKLRDVSQGGFGLFSVRERLESLGGCFSIESAPGKGTIALLALPVARA